MRRQNFGGIFGARENLNNKARRETMPLDMLDRLCLDPGTRTIGELLQEREWALAEIRRLRVDVGRLSRKQTGKIYENTVSISEVPQAQRLLRLAEVSAMVGLRRSAIYQYVSEGRFPAPVKIGIRGVRWKLSDVLVWQKSVSE
jgi:prophage regulatory protein